jgi:hypothetical protein
VPTLAAEEYSLIEKETKDKEANNEYRRTSDEGRRKEFYRILIYIKKTEQSDTILRYSSFKFLSSLFFAIVIIIDIT